MGVLTAKSLGGGGPPAAPQEPVPLIGGKPARIASLRELVEQLPRHSPARKQFEKVCKILGMSETADVLETSDPMVAMIDLARLWKLKVVVNSENAKCMRSLETWVDEICVEIPEPPAEPPA